MIWRWAAVATLTLSAPCILSAEPLIFYRGIVNAASFVPPGPPHSAIARGSIFTIFGRDLGPAEGVKASAFPLQPALAGSSVELCRDDQCFAAIPIFVRADQINAVMPSNAPLGWLSARVTYEGETGNFAPVQVVESSFGAFSANGPGYGPAIAFNG